MRLASHIRSQIFGGGLVRNGFAAIGAIADRAVRPGPDHPYAHPTARITAVPPLRVEEDRDARPRRSA